MEYFSGVFLAGLALAYAAIVENYRRHWLAMPEFRVPEDYAPQARVSVIVPARDEAAHIESCLCSLLEQSYPPELFEILLVDDYSSDGTAEIAAALGGSRVHILSLRDAPDAASGLSYKKQALEWGIRHASGDLILTTDGDCMVPPDWIRRMAYAYEVQGWQCITGPVLFFRERNLLQRFQSLDFAGMMLLTGAGFRSGLTHLANGASFGFSKKAFYEVGGYRDNLHVASGDDLFLMHKIMGRYPGHVGFIKTREAVCTEAPGSIGAFVRQRLRWGTKSAAYQDRRITLVLALVFFHCWGILLTLPALLFRPVEAAVLLLIQLAAKAIADYRMLYAACAFFDRKALMKDFWPAQAMHILYIAGIGLAANLVRQYRWKGRVVR